MASSDPRASWQVDECPQWCVVTHLDDDHIDDRKHVSAQFPFPANKLDVVPSAAGAARDSWQDCEFVCCIHRRDGQVETAIYIGDGEVQRIEIEILSLDRLLESALRAVSLEANSRWVLR